MDTNTVKVFNSKQYEELIKLYDSWWDSMPPEMQKEIREFYERN